MIHQFSDRFRISPDMGSPTWRCANPFFEKKGLPESPPKSANNYPKIISVL